MNKVWTEQERDVIRQYAAVMHDGQLADKISALRNKSVSIQAVRKQRQKMGIHKAKGRGVCRVVDMPNITPISVVMAVVDKSNMAATMHPRRSD